MYQITYRFTYIITDLITKNPRYCYYQDSDSHTDSRKPKAVRDFTNYVYLFPSL